MSKIFLPLNPRNRINLLILTFAVSMSAVCGGTLNAETLSDGNSETANSEQQQNRRVTVTGTVVDKDGKPVIGATVLEKGTTNGLITDSNGRFSLTINPGSSITVACVGYKDYSLTPNGQTNLNISLEEDQELLDEVVVVGYAVQKKVNLSGSVATADTKKLQNRALTNVGSALQGAVANLNIDSSTGDPNILPSLNIRGYTSINGGSPMIIIDGATSDNVQFNHLNPNDIESISVLKDASSAAIYGSRAAFGVILVTTKRGSGEKITVDYNNSFSWRGLTVKPEYVEDPYIYYSDWNRSQTGNPNSGTWPVEMLDAIETWKSDPDNNPDYYTAYGENFYFTFFNPADAYVKDDAFSMNHNISVSGATNKVRYYVSGNYNKEDGMLKYGRNDYKQYNVRTKLDIQVTPWWNIGSNSSLIKADYKTSTHYLENAENGMGSNPFNIIITCSPFGPECYESDGYVYDWASEVGSLEEGGDADKDDITFNQLFTTRIDIFKDVLFINGQFDFSYQKVTTDLVNKPFTCSCGPGLELYTANEPSYAEARNGRVTRKNMDIYGTFHKTFAEKHEITAILGFNQEYYRYNQQNVKREQLISLSVPSINLGYGTTTPYEYTEDWALRGLYGRLGYIYNERYIAEFNFRRDLSSRFPHDNRTVFSPSGSLAWIISKENFFEPLTNVFDLLKIRASYGKLGNQDVSDAYAYYATMGSGQYTYLIGGSRPMYVSAPGLVAGDLTWEKVYTLDFGLDLAMFDNRLNFTGDIYRRDTKDMLTSQGRDLPSVLGAEVPKENAANLKTLGWDFSIGWKDKFSLAGKPLYYNVDINLSDSHSVITKVANSAGSLSSYYEGMEIGEIWGLETAGIFATDEEAANWADQTEVYLQPGKFPQRAGTIKFADRNGDGKITKGAWTIDDHGDYYRIGNSSIRYRFGVTLGAQWNGFDLSLFFNGVLKHQYAPDPSDHLFWGKYCKAWWSEPEYNYTQRWTEENQDTDKYFPRLEQANAQSTNKELGIPQTRYLQNAAFIRLKNLTFGYTLPENIYSKLPVSRIRIYYSGENLFFISGLHKGYNVDPENLGFQYYPLQRRHTFGLNITF